MRRSLLLIAIAVALLVATAVPGIAKPGNGAKVVHFDEIGCDVNWRPAALGEISDPACRFVNVRTANGAYHGILHGQIPDGWMDEFIADGAPKTYETGCLANYGFLVAAGWPEDMELVVTTSVRRFTPDGKMTEVCHYKPEL